MIDRAGATKRCAGVFKVATTLAFLPLPFLASYTASKMFVLMYTEALAAEGRHEPVDLITLCPGPPHRLRPPSGFSLGSFPGAIEPAFVARQALDALGKRSIHVVGPISRSLLHPGLTMQHLVAQALAVAMRTFGRRVRAPHDLPAA